MATRDIGRACEEPAVGRGEPANLVPDSAEEPAVGRGEPANLVPEPAEEPHVRHSEPANLVPEPDEEPAVGPGEPANLVPEPAEKPHVRRSEPANLVLEPAEEPAVGSGEPAPEVGKSRGVIVCQFCGCPDALQLNDGRIADICSPCYWKANRAGDRITLKTYMMGGTGKRQRTTYNLSPDPGTGSI
jgi:hypothetical protein